MPAGLVLIVPSRKSAVAGDSRLSESLRKLISESTHTPPESSDISVKSLLISLVEPSRNDLRSRVRDISLCCACLSSSSSSSSALITWIPKQLALTAESAFRDLAEAVYGDPEGNVWGKSGDFGVDLSCCIVEYKEKRLVVELLPVVLPLIKDTIKDSCVGGSDDGDEISASSARAPVGHAIIAAHQLLWFVTQVDRPHLGKLCDLVIPCALTALDHWSPQVKGQGMLSFIHLGLNVNPAQLGGYVDVILDACCSNIISNDEIWHLAVEMYEKLLNEMLGHLERQPRDKERRIVWLKFIDPLFSGIGLVLLSNFRRLFPLFFLWIHADDDETVVLALARIHTMVKLTWIRSSPFIPRLVDELVTIYKESAMRKGREEIRTRLSQLWILLYECKPLQFVDAWGKYKDDPDLEALGQFISQRDGAKIKFGKTRKNWAIVTRKKMVTSSRLDILHGIKKQVDACVPEAVEVENSRK
ncbi:hypothetical protein AKJ16_DCAP00018 [Drosera capensis]